MRGAKRSSADPTPDPWDQLIVHIPAQGKLGRIALVIASSLATVITLPVLALAVAFAVQGESVVAAVALTIVIVMSTLFLTGVWLSMRPGVWVSHGGILVKNTIRTYRAAWPQILGIEYVPRALHIGVPRICVTTGHSFMAIAASDRNDILRATGTSCPRESSTLMLQNLHIQYLRSNTQPPREASPNRNTPRQQNGLR